MPEIIVPNTNDTIETPLSSTDPVVTSTVMQLDTAQYNTFVDSTNLLTNRIEFLLLLNITFLVIFIFKMMRSRS